VFEEDELGDGMYVVLSGQCQIRARLSHAAAIPQQQAVPLSSVGVDTKLTGSGQSTDSDGSEDEAEREAVQAVPRAVRSDAEHSASFWIHKYMQQVWSRRTKLALWQCSFAQSEGEFSQTITLDDCTEEKVCACKCQQGQDLQLQVSLQHV